MIFRSNSRERRHHRSRRDSREKERKLKENKNYNEPKYKNSNEDIIENKINKYNEEELIKYYDEFLKLKKMEDLKIRSEIKSKLPKLIPKPVISIDKLIHIKNKDKMLNKRNDDSYNKFNKYDPIYYDRGGFYNNYYYY